MKKPNELSGRPLLAAIHRKYSVAIARRLGPWLYANVGTIYRQKSLDKYNVPAAEQICR
ncbi:MAG: hypothetical protein AB1762_22270 [Gemmatimonadota bacterium]